VVSRTNELRADLKVSGQEQVKRALNETGNAAENAGDDLNKMARDAGFLAASVAAAKAEIKSLTEALDQTGNLELVKSIRKEKRSLKLFESLAAELAPPAQEAGSQVGDALASGLWRGFGVSLGALKGPGIGAVAGLAALLVPTIGATIGAAVLTGIGAAGVAGGIAAAAQDSRVKEAGADLAATIADAFATAGEPMVAPTIAAIKVLKTEGSTAIAELGKAFQVVAPEMVPLAKGLTGLVHEFVPGLTKGLEASKPLLLVLAKELPQIGSALGDFFAAVSEDSDGAVIALKWLLNLTEDIIITTGEWIGWLERAYEKSIQASRVIGAGLEEAFGWIPLLGDAISSTNADLNEMIRTGQTIRGGKLHAEEFADGIDDVGDSAKDATKQLDEMKHAMDELFGRTMDLDQATMRYQKGLRDLAEELTEGRRTLNAATEDGYEHRGAVLDQIEAIKSLRDANIENGRSIEYSNSVYDQQIEQLRTTLLKLGYNKAEVNALIDAYDRLPRDIELQLKVKGLQGVYEQVTALASLLGSRSAANAELSGTYGGGRAGGGSTSGGRTYLVGENGPELWSDNASGHMYNADQTAAMMSGSTGGSSRPVFNFSLQPSGDAVLDALLQALWPLLLRQVRVDGGDVTVLGG
jgi:hypothetical protein